MRVRFVESTYSGGALSAAVFSKHRFIVSLASHGRMPKAEAAMAARPEVQKGPLCPDCGAPLEQMSSKSQLAELDFPKGKTQARPRIG